MAPPKKMSLEEFIKNDSYGGSWADDDIDMASISVPIERGAAKHAYGSSYGHHAFGSNPRSRQSATYDNGPPYIVKLTSLPVKCDDAFIEDLFRSRYTRFVKLKVVVDPSSGILTTFIIKKVAFVELQSFADLNKVLKWHNCYYSPTQCVVIELADFDDFQYCMQFNQQHASEIEQIEKDSANRPQQHDRAINRLPKRQPPKPKPNPFGAAKPVDTVHIQEELEKKYELLHPKGRRSSVSIPKPESVYNLNGKSLAQILSDQQDNPVKKKVSEPVKTSKPVILKKKVREEGEKKDEKKDEKKEEKVEKKEEKEEKVEKMERKEEKEEKVEEKVEKKENEEKEEKKEKTKEREEKVRMEAKPVGHTKGERKEFKKANNEKQEAKEPRKAREETKDDKGRHIKSTEEPKRRDGRRPSQSETKTDAENPESSHRGRPDSKKNLIDRSKPSTVPQKEDRPDFKKLHEIIIKTESARNRGRGIRDRGHHSGRKELKNTKDHPRDDRSDLNGSKDPETRTEVPDKEHKEHKRYTGRRPEPKARHPAGHEHKKPAPKTTNEKAAALLSALDISSEEVPFRVGYREDRRYRGRGRPRGGRGGAHGVL